MKKVIILLLLFFTSYLPCYAAPPDIEYYDKRELQNVLDNLCNMTMLFNSHEYYLYKNPVTLKFKHLEKVRIKLIDIDNFTYVLVGESENENIIKDPKATTLTSFMKNLIYIVDTYFILGNTKNIIEGMTDEKWELIKQYKVAIGFSKEMVLLSKGDPSRTSQSVTKQGNIDIWWYGESYFIVFVNGYVHSINRL